MTEDERQAALKALVERRLEEAKTKVVAELKPKWETLFTEGTPGAKGLRNWWESET